MRLRLMSSASRVEDGAMQRGVYEAPFRMQGKDVFVAIDRHGNMIGYRAIEGDYQSVRDDVCAFLDATDPIPRLTLV